MGRYPALEAYLSRLPEGIRSYPTQLAKVATYRDAIRSRPVEVVPGVLPEELERVLLAEPLVSAWMPEVQQIAIYKLIGDQHFPNDPKLEKFSAWLLELNRDMLSSKLFRVLFRLLSIEQLFHGVELRWSTFRRGTSLKVLEHRPGRALLEMTYLPHLHDAETVVSVGLGVHAAAEAAGARNVQMLLEECQRTRSILAFSWVR
jgi:hypothetical protein